MRRTVLRAALNALGADLVRVIHARFRQEQLTAEVFAHVTEDLWVGLPRFGFRCSVRAWVRSQYSQPPFGSQLKVPAISETEAKMIS